MTFATWEEAHKHAQAAANSMNLAHGIEFCKYDKRWVVRMLPRKENRYGCDARCEAVEPMVTR
jgi:hypothetical protein